MVLCVYVLDVRVSRAETQARLNDSITVLHVNHDEDIVGLQIESSPKDILKGTGGVPPTRREFSRCVNAPLGRAQWLHLSCFV